jgi:predicted alpha/beta-hydrolase family hydrolase
VTGALLLAPGAGADRTSAPLVAIDEELTKAGWVVERMDFPYRLAGRRAPDRAPVLLAAVRAAAEALAVRTGLAPERLLLGGRSMGGRICSMAVAEGLPAAGLVLVSYPLHPPGRPEKQPDRTRHFGSIGVPCLFVSGTRDAFGAPEELQAATAAIPGPVTHAWIEGGDHGLRGQNVQVARRIAGWVSIVI